MELASSSFWGRSFVIQMKTKPKPGLQKLGQKGTVTEKVESARARRRMWPSPKISYRGCPLLLVVSASCLLHCIGFICFVTSHHNEPTLWETLIVAELYIVVHAVHSGTTTRQSHATMQACMTERAIMHRFTFA